jgi:hypothetical protein
MNLGKIYNYICLKWTGNWLIMGKIRKLFYAAVCISLFVSVVLSTHAQAIEPKITDILISSNQENVLLYARLINGFKPEMESAILAGVPTVFSLQLDVYQERPYVWNKKINSQEIKRIIKYDNLKKTFSIYTTGNPEPAIFPDFESAQNAMADFSGIIATPISFLERGKYYYLEMKIKIDKVRLPLHMEYIFFFVSFWDFETAWYRQNFSY